MPGFVDRHIGTNTQDQEAMLSVLGYASLDALIADTVPAGIMDATAPELKPALSEVEMIARLRELASLNLPARSLIGQGYYGTHTPAVIQRNVLENPAWYTAYTPYQPEISQGRLEAMLNFQTMICDLTGLDVAGASLLDESTAAAEAMTLMARNHKGDAHTLWVDADTHPQTLTVLETRATPLGFKLRVADVNAPLDFSDCFGVILSYPSSTGAVRDLRDVIAVAKNAGLLTTLITDPLSLLLLTPPAELGADVAVGSAQRFGVPMAFGGPHAGYIAVRAGLERSLPGRLVGVSVDSHGHPAYRLSLQTREQHIRREKATSNICTAQALLAVMASMYAVYHGWDGLKAIAQDVHAFAVRFHGAVGQRALHSAVFDTVSFRPEQGAAAAVAAANSAGFNLRQVSQDVVAVSFDETVTDAEFTALLSALGLVEVAASGEIPSQLHRKSVGLTHPTFSSYRSETEMMRYLRRLADMDLALDRTMIPLGSCTMKLNAATEMAAITWPEFANVHPYAPESQVQGWLELIAETESDLATLTGYAKVSVQPNAGSQGEFAGLLAIARYHASRGEHDRKICLIPSSAHGTNAASAVMAGMRVVVVSCDDAGNVDLDDLRAKISQYATELAAIMITYPSTHGVFEEAVQEICAAVHEAGGQVYVDGANLNALVGLSRPGVFGSDVSHLNLHKTFAIPHGGGGPGIGPVGVRAHLAEFLPGDPRVQGSGAVSAAPHGSAGVLPISFSYIRMMGGEGLRHATRTAILGANYLAKRLGQHFPVLYSNQKGLVAHECILDLREITSRTGVTVDDIAKRLIDFGFHAPTMSFPVAGTLMVEPTESESLFELDRFISAMLAIADEIAAIENGSVELGSSALRNAPHTAASLLGSESSVAERKLAGLPHGVDPRAKYWPPVGRIDGAYGDRNLVCTCPPISEFAN